MCVLSTQRAFTLGVKLYDNGDYEGAVVLFEEALEEYYRADVECRALCQGPHRFEDHDHILYHYSLYELISGTTTTQRPFGTRFFFIGYLCLLTRYPGKLLNNPNCCCGPGIAR